MAEDKKLNPIVLKKAENKKEAFFTSYRHPEDPRKLITVFGDNHAGYAGSVVKAMASAKNGYKKIVELFPDAIPGSGDTAELEDFFAKIEDLLVARVHQVNRLTPTIVEVVVRAPMAARKFQPGEFYRLQSYERDAPIVQGTRLNMEALAMTGADVNPELGLLSMIALEIGASTKLVAHLKVGQRVVVMGPTGSPTHIPRNETVLLAGGGLGNAVLFSISKALKANGCKVIYFAGYKNGEDLYKREDIEGGTDQVIWCADSGTIEPHRPQDLFLQANIVETIHAYASGALANPLITLNEVRRIIAIGSDGMMNAIRIARHTILKDYLSNHVAIGSINSPMQCMMKEICAQCLQKHIDPKTGMEVTPVFSCFNQDQELDAVDFDHLKQRLRQNSVLEKMATSWVQYLFEYQEN